MKTLSPTPVAMAAVCVAACAGTFVATIAIQSYFFKEPRESLVDDSKVLETPNTTDRLPEFVDIPREAVDLPVVELKEKPAEPEPAPEETVAETDDVTEEPGEPEAPEEEVVVGYRIPAGNSPPILNNTPDDLRDDILSGERFLVRVPDSALAVNDTTPGANRGSNPNSTAGADAAPTGIPETPPTETPDVPGPVDIPPDSSDDTIASVGLRVRTDRLNAALEASAGENGLLVALSNEPAGGGKAESGAEASASHSEPEPSAVQPQTTNLLSRKNGRVVVGQNTLYSNGLGGGVSGLIGGLDAPVLANLVPSGVVPQQAGIQQSERAAFAGVSDRTGIDAIASKRAGVNGVTGVNASRNVPASIHNVANRGAAVTRSIAPGLLNNANSNANLNISGNGKGLSTQLPVNLPPVQLGINPPGLNIKLNVGGR